MKRQCNVNYGQYSIQSEGANDEIMNNNKGVHVRWTRWMQIDRRGDQESGQSDTQVTMIITSPIITLLLLIHVELFL
jgi:hypothetical protein